MIDVYIAGPINSPVPGIKKGELKDLFGDLQRWLKINYGHWVTVNPLNVYPRCDGSCKRRPRTENPSSAEHTWECEVKWDLMEMLKCEAIVLLPGWELSNGARVEEALARLMHMQVFYAELYEDPVTCVLTWRIT